jgi:uncharacterized protein (DUF433 family)
LNAEIPLGFCNFGADKILPTMNYGAINIDPETMGGTPVFTGTRVPIQALFDYIETGETLDEFLENFPSVKKEYALQVLKMARKTLTTEKILNENFT